jgi:hypothetical protein
MMKHENQQKLYNGIICNDCGGKFYDVNPKNVFKNMFNDGNTRTVTICEGCDCLHYRILTDLELKDVKNDKKT